MRSWRVAGVGLVSLLVLAGCGTGVDVYVKEYEGGDVEVKSCHKIGSTVSPAGTYPAEAEDGGDQEDELWKCTIREPAGSAERCYVVHESNVRTIVRGVGCDDT